MSEKPSRPIYLDCAATTPIEPRVLKEVIHYMEVEFGNAGSRTHEYGMKAKKAVEKARKQVAHVVACKPDEVIFTSGATESNNIALLGLQEHGQKTGKKHIISTQIEHKAILEPLKELEKRGFEVTLLPPNRGGWVEPEKLHEGLRDDTLLVSIMHVNNETGVIQPLEEYAEILKDHEAYFHTDAAQGFGKDIPPLQNPRIDMISISGHKIYAPKGIGALITRRRGYERLPLKPLMFGGGQERGLRPGTQAVHLIAGLGLASELSLKESKLREELNKALRDQVLEQFNRYKPLIHGDRNRMISNILNLSLPEWDSEAAILKLKDIMAISNGSACTSNNYDSSHVLNAMGVTIDLIKSSIRISYSHFYTEAFSLTD